MKNYEIFLLVMLTIVLTRKSNAQLGGSHFGFTFPLYRVGKYIFKQGDRSDMNSYRLISLISAIAKVFERIVYNQLSSYLSKNNKLFCQNISLVFDPFFCSEPLIIGPLT